MVKGLDLGKIKQSLNHDCELFLFEKTDSTNNQARLKVKQGCVIPLACFAEEQTQGRGRRGKVWASPAGSSIYLSLAWKFDTAINDLGGLSLAIGVALARVLKHIGLKSVGLKWPNDVLFDGRKIAGILIETAQLSNQTTTVIIGVGLNYKLPEQVTDEITQPCTDIVSSLQAMSLPEKEVGRNKVAGLLLRECLLVCENFVQNRQILMSEYYQYDVCHQQLVDIYQEGEPQMQGLVVGFETNGEIRVRIDGKERLFNSADISLRKANNAND